MDSTSIELTGSKIAAVSNQGDDVHIVFEPAFLIKHMTGSVERTRWWQNGALVFEGATMTVDGELPELPAPCEGGDVGENVYTYRDMIPVPLVSRGRAHCDLRVGEAQIRVEGSGVHLDLVDVAKYIEHLRPD